MSSKMSFWLGFICIALATLAVFNMGGAVADDKNLNGLLLAVTIIGYVIGAGSWIYGFIKHKYNS